MQNSLKFPEEISYLPSSPGVYVMKDEKGEVIYVGKAKSLKHRVNSYKRPKDIKTRLLVERIDQVEFIVTSSEDEALLLENNLIKKHFPKFNVRLVDDENYPYIKLTIEPYPKIMKVYRIRGENGEYFGPFPHGHAVDVTIKTLRKVFPVRSCSLKINDSKNYEPCLLYHIGLCSAPCAHKISQHEYLKIVDALKKFLRGDNGEVLRNLQAELDRAKNELDFERGIIYRDAIKGLSGIIEKQRVMSSMDVSFDLIACEVHGDLACVVSVSVRNGRVISTYPFIMNILGGERTEEIIENFILLYPFHAQGEKVYLESVPKNRKTLEKYTFQKNLRKTKFFSVRGNIQKQVLSLAKENAKFHLENYIERHVFLKEEKTLLSLKEKLNLKRIPRRIEGYDISNISGNYAVGSMVVFENGHPNKKEYKKFKVKLTKGPNDYAMIFEILSRRLMESERFSKRKPDLLLIDGGKGQLNTVLRVKKFLNIEADVISLAKKKETVFSENAPQPINLPEDSEELKLLQRVRDESHRFAKKYFKTLHLRTARGKVEK